MKMSDQTEATMAIVAAMLVLFSAMLDPRLSAGLAVGLLIALAVFKFIQSRQSGSKT
jgi:hypothetical protein